MAKDSEASLNELEFFRIALRILASQKPNNRLRYRHPANHEDTLLAATRWRTLARPNAKTDTQLKASLGAKRLSLSGFPSTLSLSWLLSDRDKVDGNPERDKRLAP